MDKKPSLLLAIGRMKPRREKDSYSDEGYTAAFEELMDAIEHKDIDAGVSALKSFVEQCQTGDEPEEEEASEDSFH